MEKRIKMVMAAIFGLDVNNIDENTSPHILEKWDSLAHMTLIIALEEEFGIEFNSEEIVEMVSYPLIKIVIEEKISEIKGKV